MGKTTSVVWQHFSFPKQSATPKQAICKLLVNGNECGRQLTKTSAWNAKRHLRDIHGIDLFGVDEQRRQAAPSKISRLKVAIQNAREERSRLRLECQISHPPMTPCQEEAQPIADRSATGLTSLSNSLPLAERRKEQNRKNVERHRRVEKMLEQTLQRIRNEVAELKGGTRSRAPPAHATCSDLSHRGLRLPIAPLQRQFHQEHISFLSREYFTEINGFFGALGDPPSGSLVYEWNTLRVCDKNLIVMLRSSRTSPITLALSGQQAELAPIPLEWVDELFQTWDASNADLRPLSQLDDPLIPFVCRYKDLFIANMQSANAPLDHAFRAVQSWYSVGMTDLPVGTRNHAKLRGCFVLEVEKDFLRHLMQNASVWMFLASLKSAISVGSPDECGILQRLYYILCRTVASVFDDSSHYKNDDDDYLIMVGESDLRRRNRLTAVDREYFYSPLSFNKSMMDSLAGKVTRQGDTSLLRDVVGDVFSFALSGALNFNFYEECATNLPTLREAFKQCIHELPREHVKRAWLSRTVVEYERTMPFVGAYYHQRFIIESHWRSCYRAKMHPRTLKRYSIDTLLLTFSKLGFLLPFTNHLDAVCPEFLTNMSNLRAKHMMLSGFKRHHMKEVIDKAKYCASHAEYVQCICFRTVGIEQFEAVLENGRELPKTAKNLCISMRTSYRKPIPAPRLNPKRRGPSEAFFLPHGFLSGYELARIIERNSSILRQVAMDGEVRIDIELERSVKVVDVLSAVESFFNMFMAKSIVPKMKLTIANAANDIKQIMLFGLTNGFTAKSDSIGMEHTDLTMGRLRDDGRAFEVHIFEESDNKVRALIGVGEPQKTSNEVHSDYWHHSHCMDFAVDYDVKA